MNHVRFCFAAIAVTALMITGCGGQTNVTGTVKYSDGTPLDRGTVNFDSDSFASFGTIQSDGSVVVGEWDGGVPDGTYTVTVEAMTDGNMQTDDDGNVSGEEPVTLVKNNKTTVTIDSSNKTFELTVEKAGGAAAPE